ncbi:hypothetical protein AB0O22_37625 [Streptomyces sp. NPDC091204]|uniref:hypothetical protein n=1 Tax=Streptomyces sp. NPDC091204 TaxID=3155299 RepID=UPI0034343EAD
MNGWSAKPNASQDPQNQYDPHDTPEPSVPTNTLITRLVVALGGCAVAFFVILGVMAVLPRAVQDSLPPGVLGGAVVVLGVAAARRFTRRAR